LHFTQDDVAVQPDVAETRDQTEQAAEQDEQDGRTHPIALAQYRPDDHGGNQRDDHYQGKHPHTSSCKPSYAACARRRNVAA
jgi:hypothetical protein